jgi:hypothetical protein
MVCNLTGNELVLSPEAGGVLHQFHYFHWLLTISTHILCLAATTYGGVACGMLAYLSGLDRPCRLMEAATGLAVVQVVG